MDYTLDELKAAPAFGEQPVAKQAALEREYTQDAWNESRKDLTYYSKSGTEKLSFKESFDAIHPMGPEVRVEEDNIDNSFAKNFGLQFGQGVRSTYDSLKTADDVVKASADYPKQLASFEALRKGTLVSDAERAQFKEDTGVDWDTTRTEVDPARYAVADDLAGRILASQERLKTAYTPGALKDANNIMLEATKNMGCSKDRYTESSSSIRHLIRCSERGHYQPCRSSITCSTICC